MGSCDLITFLHAIQNRDKREKQDRRYSDPKARNGQKIRLKKTSKNNVKKTTLKKLKNSSKNSSKNNVEK